MGNGEAQQVEGVAAPVTRVVETDLRCVRCGYNLRTLELEGRCPECGEQIGESLKARPWVGTDRNVLLWAAVGLVLLVVASGIWIGAAMEGGGIAALVHQEIKWLEISFAIGPAGPKLALIPDLARGGDARPIALLGLSVHLGAVGLLGALAASKSAGMGRIRGVGSFLMGIAGWVLGVGVAGGRTQNVGNILLLDPLAWLFVLDAVAVLMMNIQIAMIADAGGKVSAAAWARMSAMLQVLGSMMGAVIVSVVRDEWWWPAATLVQGVGGIIACVVALWVAAVLIREWRWRASQH